MAQYDVLVWQNENSLIGYPLASRQDINDFIVDANFVQFDGFQPVLQTVLVSNTHITLTLLLDAGALSFNFDKSAFSSGVSQRYLRLYNSARYLGCLTFGAGTLALWTDYIGRLLTYNAPFAISTVRSIPSHDAVYTLDSLYGEVVMNRTTDDKTIFYNKSLDLNSITFNAVAGHYKVGDSLALLKINLVSPKDNNITLASNDVIKIDSTTGTSLTVSVVGSSSGQSTTIVPTLAS